MLQTQWQIVIKIGEQTLYTIVVYLIIISRKLPKYITKRFSYSIFICNYFEY